jgi:uncharacterized protein
MTTKTQNYIGKIVFVMIFILMVSGFIFMRNVDKTSSTQKATPLYILHNYMNDYGKLLTLEQSRQINRTLLSYEQITGNQLVVVTINRITGYSPEIYSVKLAQKNGIGKKGKDKGIMFFISKQDHFMRIEVGMGMEGKLTDMKCSLILKNIVKPCFKNNQFNMGIKFGLASIINIVSGTTPATQLFPNINKNFLADDITSDPSKTDKLTNKTKEEAGKYPIANMIVIGLLLIILFFIGIRYPKIFGIVFWIIIAILNSRGGGSGGSSGNGGFSGGGGSFGGGGSSDDW